MKGPHSISLRLTIFVSLAVISGGILAWPFVVWTGSLINSEEFASLNALGLNQAQYVVAQSLRRGSDGVAYVEATPGLGAYKKESEISLRRVRRRFGFLSPLGPTRILSRRSSRTKGN